MSIVNAWIGKREALLAVDTMSVGEGGAQAHVSKLAPLIHVNAAIAVRGHALFAGILFMVAHLLKADDYDAFVDGLQTNLPMVFGEFIKQERALMIDPMAPADRQRVTVVGWSPKLGRMRGWKFNQDDRAAGFVRTEIARLHVTPWDASIEPLPAPSCTRNMMQIARAQVRLYRDKHPSGRGAGGRLLIATITREEIVVRVAGNLDLDELLGRPIVG